MDSLTLSVDSRWVSVATFSRMLDIEEKTIRKWVAQRRIPYKKVNGKLIRIDLAEVGSIIQEVKPSTCPLERVSRP